MSGRKVIDHIRFKKRMEFLRGKDALPSEVWYLYVNGVKQKDYYVIKLDDFDREGNVSSQSYVSVEQWARRGKSRIDTLDFSLLSDAKRTLIDWYYEYYESRRQNTV